MSLTSRRRLWGVANATTTTLTRLTPQEFKAQLYAALVDSTGRWLLPRVAIEWGQPEIRFTQLEKATFIGMGIFDREDGGDYLDGALFAKKRHVWPGDQIICYANWFP